MLRKEQRRHERRSTLRRRLLAGSTAAILALGMAAGGAAPAFATPPSSGLPTPIVDAGGVTTYDQGGLVCSASSIGFQKPAALDNLNSNDGSFTAAWGTISWDASERTVTWSIVDGWDVDVCVKGGTVLSIVDTSETEGTSYTHTYAGLSHLGFRINASTPGNDLDCVTATNFQGRALTNGDHINMDIVQGGSKFQINAQIDIRQSQDPASESGLVVRVNAPGGPYTLPLSNAERDSGVFAFSYSTYLTGQWTVEWVQFNSTYFNQDRSSGAFLICGDLPTENLVTPTARMVDLECDTTGSYTLDDVDGVRWFIGNDEIQPGTYTVTTAQTIVVRAEADAPEFGLEPGATDEFTFVFTEPDDCVLPCLPASAVSYTYYNLSTATSGNPANSGLITVAARDGYSDELCNDFWVVAAAWNYSSSTSIWPQTLRSTDPAGDDPEGYIGSVGTYFFHAPVECGQGDVYASFTGMPYVGPELFGPSNPFTERFLHGMGFTGPTPTYLNTQPGCNVANPIAPTANPIVECGTYGSIDVSDVANPYVGYTVYRGVADENGSVAGLDSVAIDDATEGVFTVVATPLNGYIFAPGTERQWEFDLGEYTPCPVEVDLRLTYMEECAPDPTYTFRVKNLSDVSVPYTYVVAGNPSLNGSGVAPVGDSFFDLDVDRTNPATSYTVTLHWGDGTTIVADSTVKASGRDKVCSLTVQPVVDIECTTDGSYTVPTVLGVTWSIAGTPVAPGTYTVTDESAIVLRATAASGYVLYNGGTLSQTRDFTLEFTEPELCLPPTFDGETFTASECDNDTPWINYSVVVNDPDGQLTSTTARLIFAYPGDETKNHVIELGEVTVGEPLTGRILWPGASVDPITGEPTGWPGWAQDVDGNWYETAYDENFAWTRTLTEVTLEVNPEMQIAIAYPPATTDCTAEPITVEPVAQKSTCERGGASILLPPVEGVVWFVNGVETPGSLTPIEVLEAGNYTVTVEIDPDAEGGPYAFADGAVTSWPFVFTDDELCELGQETFTNASIGFIDPTCDLGQRLDPSKLIVADDTLAELQSYEEFTDGSYEVVFVTIDPDARFVEFETPTPGRTVSDGGTVLTFTGQLLGPDRSSECVTTVELTDPVTYTDSCLFGGSFTIYRVEGIAYTVFINDETPFVVEWADGELTRTYDVEQGDSVRVEPSPESDRYTISPDPAPFERTFAVYDDDCLPTLPLTEGSVTFTPATCLDATNWVVLPSTEGVQWWVDGEQTAAGKWAMPAGEVVVEATPLQGYGFPLEAETRWEYEFAAADEACDLSSLAETGASNALVGIGLAAVLITLAGFGVVIGRRFQQA
ncbi:hypothetical protein [Microcella sp.]|uniref:hypothetical protein n=1 Tax=Microcella sp. TaxID=1913979 RepID=UPI00256B9A75|nr:hypothetical protein [Microcella sp.]MBX9472070.1 hypothetical protein [Microcella sp.]